MGNRKTATLAATVRYEILNAWNDAVPVDTIGTGAITPDFASSFGFEGSKLFVLKHFAVCDEMNEQAGGTGLPQYFAPLVWAG